MGQGKNTLLGDGDVSDRESAQVQVLSVPPLPSIDQGLRPCPSAEEFLLHNGLYDKYETDNFEQLWQVLEILYPGGTYDGHCIECERESTFRFDGSCTLGKPARDHEAEEQQIIFEGSARPPIFPQGIRALQANCARTHTHTQQFLIFVESELVGCEYDQILKVCIEKIGQRPAFGSTRIATTKKYVRILGKERLREFNKAIHLASHDVGIGAYTYLRRIFEGLLEDARIEASASEGWDEPRYQSGRVSDRIQLLRSHLPEFLSQHPELYSLLSKGIHELSDTECMLHFESLRVAIELILDQRIEHEERKKKIAEASGAIKRAASAVNSRSAAG